MTGVQTCALPICQLSLFELGPSPESVDAEPDYPEIPEFEPADLLAMEKEMLGLYVTGHPLNEYAEAISLLTNLDSAAFSNLLADPADRLGNHTQTVIADGDRVIMAGMLSGRKNKTTKNNELMSFLTVEDLYGQYEVLVFPKVLTACADVIDNANVLLISGRLSIREDEAPKLVADQIAMLDKQASRLPTSFGYRANGPIRRTPKPVAIPSSAMSPPAPPQRTEEPISTTNTGQRALAIRYTGSFGDPGYNRLLASLAYFHGDTPVRVFLPAEDRFVNMPQSNWVDLSDELLRILADRYGTKNIAII